MVPNPIIIPNPAFIPQRSITQIRHLTLHRLNLRSSLNFFPKTFGTRDFFEMSRMVSSIQCNSGLIHITINVCNGSGFIKFRICDLQTKASVGLPNAISPGPDPRLNDMSYLCLTDCYQEQCYLVVTEFQRNNWITPIKAKRSVGRVTKCNCLQWVRTQ